MFNPSSLLPGTILLPLRLVLGWTYFSAFWRRLILENKLIPDQAGYIGEKFNHFLPNALFVDSSIEFFLTHPTLLWWKLLLFTLFEGVVGLALIFGLFTRVAGLSTAALATGILFGAGWLGTTCLDEWQIGILGLAGGLTIAVAGGGRFSLDAYFTKKGLLQSPLLSHAAGLIPHAKFTTLFTVASAVIALTLTLFTNQVFHGGVWGKLHNLSVKPKVEITQAIVSDGQLSLQLYRVEGADVYGSFAIAIEIRDEAGKSVANWTATDLAQLPKNAIQNKYIAKIQPGAHSLILPLGAKGTVTLTHPALTHLLPQNYTVTLTDISGLSWSAPLAITLDRS